MFRSIIPLTLAALVGCSPVLKHTGKQAYALYNIEGQHTTYQRLLEDAKNADLIFFGELHDNPISHWLQFELTQDLYQHSNDLVLGAEMFEADTQKHLDDYFGGKIDEKEFKKSSRAWPNYDTDYAPLIEFAKKKKLPFIATNIPRRFAKIIAKGGSLEELTQEEKAWVVPLPFEFDPELELYKKMTEMMKDHAPNVAQAQAIKDATMAHFIQKNLRGKFIHFNGAYHSDNFEGIVWYLRNADLKIMTIKTTEQGDIKVLGDKGRANYTICVDENMTKTY